MGEAGCRTAEVSHLAKRASGSLGRLAPVMVRVTGPAPGASFRSSIPGRLSPAPSASGGFRLKGRADRGPIVQACHRPASRSAGRWGRHPITPTWSGPGPPRGCGAARLSPSTLGTFLGSFTVGHVQQLDVVAREVVRRAWEGDRGPSDAALTIDMVSTICQVLGLLREGVGFGYTKLRGTTCCWPPGPTRARCSSPGCGVDGHSRPGAPLGSWPIPSLGRARPGHRPGDLAGGPRLLLQGAAHYLPPGRGRFSVTAREQSGPAGDCGHPRGGVGADPLLVELKHLRCGRAGAADLRHRCDRHSLHRGRQEGDAASPDPAAGAPHSRQLTGALH